MTISVVCSNCGSKLLAPDLSVGHILSCPKCATRFKVSRSIQPPVPSVGPKKPPIENRHDQSRSMEEVLGAFPVDEEASDRRAEIDNEEIGDSRRHRRTKTNPEGEDSRPTRGHGLRLRSINDELPDEFLTKLRKNEKAYEFAYIDTKGGCGSTRTAEQWILVTDQRILYEGTVKETTGAVTYSRNSGSVPLAKVSFVGTTTSQKTDGCQQMRVSLLRINSGGGEIHLVIPTERQARRLQGVIDDLLANTR